jgi:tetratricopeptide (TPR) repeat protein
LLQALEHYESLTNNAMFYPIDWGGYLAENYCAIDDPDKALAAIDRGFAFAESSGEHWSDAELFRMRGVALALRDGANGNDEAETWLRRAIEDARSRQAKSFELRAALSLSRLLRDQGRHALARETLVPVYDWFTEGFDTPDLIDAKALKPKHVERQVLAKSRRQRASSITTGLHPKADVELPMSAFPLFTTGVGGKAAVN